MNRDQRLLIFVGLLALAIMLHFLLCTWKAGGRIYVSVDGRREQTLVGGSGAQGAYGVYSRQSVDVNVAAIFGIALPFTLFVFDWYLVLGWRHQERASRGLCTKCGYDLRATNLPKSKCPECGTPVVERAGA